MPGGNGSHSGQMTVGFLSPVETTLPGPSFTDLLAVDDDRSGRDLAAPQIDQPHVLVGILEHHRVIARGPVDRDQLAKFSRHRSRLGEIPPDLLFRLCLGGGRGARGKPLPGIESKDTGQHSATKDHQRESSN